MPRMKGLSLSLTTLLENNAIMPEHLRFNPLSLNEVISAARNSGQQDLANYLESAPHEYLSLVAGYGAVENMGDAVLSAIENIAVEEDMDGHYSPEYDYPENAMVKSAVQETVSSIVSEIIRLNFGSGSASTDQASAPSAASAALTSAE